MYILIKKDINMTSAFDSFFMYLSNVRGRSLSTIDEYKCDLSVFVRYLLKLKNKDSDETADIDTCFEKVDDDLLKSVSSIEILEYMNYLATDRDCSPSTRARKLASLRSFYKYLTVHLKLIESDPVHPIDGPKLKKRLPKFLSLDESKIFLETIKNTKQKYWERDYAMSTIFLNCGLRLSELVSINLNDIGTDNSLRVIGKGDKERLIYLNKACIEAIKAYMSVRGESKDKNALFLSRIKKRISPKTVQYLMTKYFKLAGFGNRGLSTHKLRHTAATLMYQHGNVDIRVLQEVLGHENISLTKIYTHTSNSQVKKAIDSNPLSNV